MLSLFKNDKNRKLIYILLICVILIHSYDILKIKLTVENGNNKSVFVNKQNATTRGQHTAVKDKDDEMKNLIVPYDYTKLPNIQSKPNGTFIVFFHLGKTGGTSVRFNLQNLKDVKYDFCQSLQCYIKAENKVEEKFQTFFKSLKKTYIFEIHAGSTPPFVTIGDQIQAWRDLSAANNVRFFAFTIVRNPLAQSISHFNDHCLSRRKTCKLEKNASLVDSFMYSKERIPNFQTHYYVLGNAMPYEYLYEPEKKKSKKALSLNHNSANLVFQSMIKYLDWVGTTECISNDTFHILQHIIPIYRNTKTFYASNVGSQNKRIHDKGLTKDMLSTSQLDYVQKLMSADTGLYHNITNHFGSCLFE